jgi:signal transduction histidine kinase
MKANPASGQPEAPIIRRTRWRLIAWSGGTTLAILVVLGIAIYSAAASSLAASGIAQLRARLGDVIVGLSAPPLQGPAGPMITVTSDPTQPGVLIGGTSSGTIAFAGPLDVLDEVPVPSPGVDEEILDVADVAIREAIDKDGEVVSDGMMGSTPVRVLATLVTTPAGTMAAVVLGDRTAELATLQTLLAVLLLGGLAVLAASVAAGYVFAGRALVPIRDSIRRQREFAADASHELRTPLSITRAAIAELRLGRRDPAVVDRALDDLEAGAGRLEQLVDDLLLLARADAEAIEMQSRDTDLGLVAAEAAESLEPVAATRGVQLSLDLEPAPLWGDEARLRQLVSILVDNAIRHSPGGGRVMVTVRPAETGAVLTVDDEGRGIAPDHLGRVFERFWRAPDAPAGGTGLGLAIGRWIVDRHRGTISAENRIPGPGARFVVQMSGY